MLSRNRRPANWDKIDDPVGFLGHHVYAILLTELLWERILEQS